MPHKQASSGVQRWLASPDGPVRCEAFSVGVPGLFVNRTLLKDLKGDHYFSEKWWVITHRWTGLMVNGAQFSKKRDAIRVAKYLTEKYDIDWDIRDGDELLATYPNLKKWFKKAVKTQAKGTVADG